MDEKQGNAFDDKQYDEKMEKLQGEEDFNMWEEVHESFDSMGKRLTL